MDTKEIKKSGNSLLRLGLVALAIGFQVGWLLLQILRLNQYSTWIAIVSSILSMILVVKIYSRHTNSAMKMPWIMLIMAFPLLGMSLYLMFELLRDPGLSKRIKNLRQLRKAHLHQNSQILERMDPEEAGHCRYLSECCDWPVYDGTKVKYYPEAVEAFEDLKEELKNARDFIFMEYFIVEDGSSFREIEAILVEKVRQGVEVRLLYDDVGSVGYVNMFFAKRLNDEGIHCYPTNPALPILNLAMNNRDHRKITVIDGKVGFTGGYNLADEYFGRLEKFGKWKDTGLRLEGAAVRSLTVAFLEMWELQCRKREDWARYLDGAHEAENEGYVQPFGDNPLGNERVAEDVYLNLINRADKTLYFITPYLIITDELSRALGLAARRGVDVRIITPGIPDKKTVYAVTRSYYAGLARQGVRMFEYSPGFCHAKMCICDGEIATVGTSNLDYRSLYHHFENNVLLVRCPAVADIQADFDDVLPQCREVTKQYASGRGAMLRTWQCILRLFAPLM